MERPLQNEHFLQQMFICSVGWVKINIRIIGYLLPYLWLSILPQFILRKLFTFISEPISLKFLQHST